MEQSVVIVAGGKGHRMNNILPKQFILLNGKPLLMYSIRAFFEYSEEMNIVVVLPEDLMDYWDELCDRHSFPVLHGRVKGGSSRFDSVKNGLDQIGNEGYVAIHDGARPCVTPSMIKRCFDHAVEYGNALPVVPPHESVRLLEDQHNRAIERYRIRICQTPQVFVSEQIKAAYNQPFVPQFTDDATVLEAKGYMLSLLEGDPGNIKITTPLDLAIAEAILNQQQKNQP